MENGGRRDKKVQIQKGGLIKKLKKHIHGSKVRLIIKVTKDQKFRNKNSYITAIK